MPTEYDDFEDDGVEIRAAEFNTRLQSFRKCLSSGVFPSVEKAIYEYMLIKGRATCFDVEKDLEIVHQTASSAFTRLTLAKITVPVDTEVKIDTNRRVRIYELTGVLYDQRYVEAVNKGIVILRLPVMRQTFKLQAI